MPHGSGVSKGAAFLLLIGAFLAIVAIIVIFNKRK